MCKENCRCKGSCGDKCKCRKVGEENIAEEYLEYARYVSKEKRDREQEQLAWEEYVDSLGENGELDEDNKYY